MKKICSLVVVLGICSSMFTPRVEADKNSDYFVVTAYYSPLPGQDNYLKGNYEDEIILNGKGIAGASGKKVFPGMLAAPKKYKFGTKIYLEGLGIGSVEDRGGAIVQAGKRGYESDRIDVWMGYGDEGLQRALYWGKRKIKGYKTTSSLPTTISIKNVQSPSWVTKGLSTIPKIFNLSLGRGSSVDQVIELQKFLKKIGKYSGPIDGMYNNTVIDIVYNLQVENAILSKGTDNGAGYWGKKTRNAVLKQYLNGDFEIKTSNKKTTQIDSIKEAKSIFTFVPVTDVQRIAIQDVFKKLNLYSGVLDGNKDTFIDMIYDYQVSKDIVDSVADAGAGYFGPKTRATLETDYNEYLEGEKRKKQLEELFKKLEESASVQAKNKLANIGNPENGEVSHQVRALQKQLSELGFFKEKDTAIFGELTKKSLISYQISKGIIQTHDEPGAGSFGPQTKDAMHKDIKENILNTLIKQEKELSGVMRESI